MSSTHTDRKTSETLKNTRAYKRRAALVMVLVLACQLLSGTGFFCANKFPHPSRSSGNDRTAPDVSALERGNLSDTTWKNAESQGKPRPCTCKKHKCPTIPRTTLVAHPTHRFNAAQRQFRSTCCLSLTVDLRSHRFAFGSAPPFMESDSGTPFYCSTPLSITGVLLI